jgi:hypothetical protein
MKAAEEKRGRNCDDELPCRRRFAGGKTSKIDTRQKNCRKKSSHALFRRKRKTPGEGARGVLWFAGA